MSNEQLQSLLTKVQSDASLRQQLETATSESIKTVAEIAKDAGIVIDANETTAHLSGDDLETMAGGAMTGPVGSAACSHPTHCPTC